jgi:hypothetical protein
LNVTENEVDVVTSQPLTSSQAAQLATIVNNYTDPAVSLQLDTTQTMPSSSVLTSTSTLTPVMTFIFTDQINFDQALDGIKTIIQVSSTNPPTFVTSPVQVTITIFDITRNIQVASQIVDLTSVFTKWQLTNQGSHRFDDSIMYWKHEQDSLLRLHMAISTIGHRSKRFCESERPTIPDILCHARIII